MASFSSLPTELVEYILSYLAQHDTYAVCQLSKALSDLALPFLYRHVDLFIRSGPTIPSIDRFCLNISSDHRKANNVQSIRLGISPSGHVPGDTLCLPPDKTFHDRSMFRKAMTALSDETLVAAANCLIDAISRREYPAYGALILLILPKLRRLDVADYKSATFDHLHSVFRNLDPRTLWNRRYSSQVLLDRFSSIQQISLMFDRNSGVAYLGDKSRVTLDHFLNLPSIETLEISNLKWPTGLQHINTAHAPLMNPMVDRTRDTNITKLVFRHSGAFTQSLTSLFECTPKLRSLTYEFFFPGPLPPSHHHNMLELDAWSERLEPFASTLEILVFSAEYCDTSTYFFQQAPIGGMLHGYLDLTAFTALHTLECPFPFLTGDVDFSITKDIYPLFPPNLRHLALRPDLSHAHLAFPFDSSILPNGLTFDESKQEVKYLTNARMDVSYMFQATLALVDYAPSLASISVWQPADPFLEWFDGQVEDFATTCRNKHITGRILKPMLLRWKKAEHWDLIKEVTVFDRRASEFSMVERFYREEWEGRPLGLGCQFHLDVLGKGKVRLRR